MKDFEDVLAVLFFGCYFALWVTTKPVSTNVWLIISAVAALIIAILALVRLVQRRRA